MRLLFIVLAAGCWVRSAAPAQISNPPRAPIARNDGRVYAVVHLVAKLDECSGAGGEHYTLAIDEPGDRQRLVHAGGHATQLWLGGSPTSVPDDYFIAELVMTPNDMRDDTGWCLDQLPAFDGEALRLIRARDRNDARTRLAEVAVTGFAETDTLRASTGGEALTILSGPIGRLNITKWIQRDGDILVVASDDRGPTRVLLAEDESDAERWKKSIDLHGWPPEPIGIGPNDANVATARWLMLATVTPGAPGCESSIISADGYGPSISLPTLIGAAPPRSKIGDRVLALVVARMTPDRCGRTVRVVRAYAASANTDPSLGIPPGSKPVAK